MEPNYYLEKLAELIIKSTADGHVLISSILCVVSACIKRGPDTTRAFAEICSDFAEFLLKSEGVSIDQLHRVFNKLMENTEFVNNLDTDVKKAVNNILTEYKKHHDKETD